MCIKTISHLEFDKIRTTMGNLSCILICTSSVTSHILDLHPNSISKSCQNETDNYKLSFHCNLWNYLTTS